MLGRSTGFVSGNTSAVAGKRGSFLFQHRLASGELREVEVHSGPIVIAGKTLLLSTIHDASSRRRLDNAQLMHAQAVGASMDGIAILDGLEKFAYVGVYFIAALVYPAGLGMGDVKLAAFLGAWLGASVIVALFAGSILAVLPAVVILVRHGRAGRKVGIPFAPFLAGGAIIALFFGDAILTWWLG